MLFFVQSVLPPIGSNSMRGSVIQGSALPAWPVYGMASAAGRGAWIAVRVRVRLFRVRSTPRHARGGSVKREITEEAEATVITRRNGETEIRQVPIENYPRSSVAPCESVPSAASVSSQETV